MDRFFFFFPVALLCSFAASFTVTAHHNISTDQSALLALRAQITYDPHGILAENWTTNNNASVCNWIGVTCGQIHPRVESLNLSFMDLGNRLPPELGNLSFLVSLDLRGNHFQGGLPRDLVRLRRLRFMSFRDNKFSGEIPSWLGYLPRLKILILSNNSFTGSLPNSMFNVSKLEKVELQFNQLTGSIPATIFNITSLQVIDFSNNRLTGNLPRDICQNCSTYSKTEMDRFFFFFPVALLCSFAASFTVTAHHNISTDQSALLALRAQITYDPHGILAENWTTNNNASVCNWIGVTCGQIHPRVESLNLSFMDLGNRLPPELGNLSFLVSLDLRGNHFQGGLPRDLVRLRRLRFMSFRDNKFSGEIPSWLGYLPRLKILILSNNSFTGSLPNSMFNVSKLEKVELQFNQLTGSIPATIFNITSLQVIDFSNNRLTGNLPRDICQSLPRLRVISLSWNGLSGQLPPSLPQCSQLQVLSLFRNMFTGDIPRGIGNMTMLQELDLNSNLLMNPGTIPREIGNLTMLTHLGLGDLNLRGTIPSEFGDFRNIGRLVLHSNSLHGSIPPGIFNNTKLFLLSLTENNLSGNLPSNINLPNVEWLSIGVNYLSGVIPHTIFNASKLRTFDVVTNNFHGSIPTSLGQLRSIEHLGFGTNFFTEPYPELRFIDSLGNCNNLIYLSLSYNPLNAAIPSSVKNLSSLQYFLARNSGLKGTIARELGNLSSLVTINLGYNSLTGSIPITFQELSNLQGLGLNDNRIGGSIPEALCHLKNIGFLYLRGNQITGMIPGCLGNVTSLRRLYLSNNKLTSTLPASLGNLHDLLALYAYSNFLNGSIPEELGSLKVATEIDLSRNNFSGEIPRTLGGLNQLINLSLAQNQLQGPIPSSFGALVALERLDLSQNKLVGSIPNSFQSLQYLKHFNASFNQLSGEIPTKGPFANFTQDSFLSNVAFCGGSPHLQFPPCQPDSPKSAMKSKTRKLLIILAPIGSIVLILGITMVFLRFRAKKSIPTITTIFPAITHERISYYELERATNGFSQENFLGKGSYGSVYKGVFLDGTNVAVKVFNLEIEGAFKSFDVECEVFRSIHHRNLVKVITSCSNLDFKALILRFMGNGSLEKWLYSDNLFLDILKRLDIIIDIASALEYLHHGYSIPIVHCDLKPSNILLDEDMVAHVSDFGITKLLGGGRDSAVRTKTLSTMGYIAPEYGSEGLVSTSCDVYSFGILAMETFTRRKSTDNSFSGDFSIRDWVAAALQNSSMVHIMEENMLISSDDDAGVAAAKVECVTLIMELGLRCSTQLSGERTSMEVALVSLKKIKAQLLPKLH
ncbi:probable LRR receptor-like serine/threonine-protein kinase At3g47570 [Ipomoea triloba]|uniref:probable LRR receptor-like serine/threonine-protein kinase At3g47570 n=1 Tax=Ipomoea triloba TaxID=35885 RepID=UPI00125DD096|nr:probable LRR receptor-like serine/threonine-protein kinase At3g47570 [Ipomoea triloba]